MNENSVNNQVYFLNSDLIYGYTNETTTTSNSNFPYGQQNVQSYGQQQLNYSNCSTNQRKKNGTIKSTLIAKKAKFWKYLEEEKCKIISLENFITTKKRIKTKANPLTSSSSSSSSGGNATSENLDCTLCDNCRCLDCQSRYFECDDDSYDAEFYDNLPNTEIESSTSTTNRSMI